MSLFRNTLIALSLLLVLLTGMASADGDGHTLKYVDGPNIIVVTPNTQHPHVGPAITYNVRLYEAVTGQPTGFERVRVGITQDLQSVYGKSLTVSPYNDADFSFAYPKEGDYTLTLQFFDKDKTTARGEFPILVEADAKKPPLAGFLTVQTGIAFLLGIGIAAFYLKRTRLLSQLKK